MLYTLYTVILKYLWIMETLWILFLIISLKSICLSCQIFTCCLFLLLLCQIYCSLGHILSERFFCCWCVWRVCVRVELIVIQFPHGGQEFSCLIFETYDVSWNDLTSDTELDVRVVGVQRAVHIDIEAVNSFFDLARTLVSASLGNFVWLFYTKTWPHRFPIILCAWRTFWSPAGIP